LHADNNDDGDHDDDAAATSPKKLHLRMTSSSVPYYVL
jgi:hypothetical protein